MYGSSVVMLFECRSLKQCEIRLYSCWLPCQQTIVDTDIKFIEFSRTENMLAGMVVIWFPLRYLVTWHHMSNL